MLDLLRVSVALLELTQSLPMSEVGLIGLGIMGAPMAGHLITAPRFLVNRGDKNQVCIQDSIKRGALAGHTVHLYSLPSDPSAHRRAGGKACTNGKEVAEKADIIITMAPDTPHVEAALFGENGVASGLSEKWSSAAV